MADTPSGPELAAELEDLRARLAEAEEVLRAIRNGEVDAVVVAGGRGEQVYTLRGADRVYRQLIETMSEGAVTLSADGVILYGNVRSAEMLGQPLDQVLGTALRNYLPPADQQALEAVLAQARTVPSRREISLKTSEGRLAPVYLSASRVQSEGAELVFCLVLTDLTEQKRHEQIVETERLARLILEQAAEPIVVCDVQGQIIRVSQAAQRFCDDKPLQRPFAEVFPLRTDASELFHLAPVLQGETLRNVDVTLDRHGQKCALILHAGPLLNGQQILGCVITMTDITAHKQAEEETAKLETHLRQAQKMEAVGRLAGGVAHDFNNLLMGIMGYTELCRDRIEPGHSIREWLDEITRDAQRSAEITRKLLAFARKQPIAPRVLDLNDAVAGMLKLLRRLVGEDIPLAWRPGADLRPVRLDPSQVDQVLVNLCINARDAIAGVGEITLETGSITVDAEYCARHLEAIPGAYVFLAVSDDGRGMDQETLAQVFEPFFTTKGIGQGTGLGLATVYGIVKQNNGFIDADSEPGKGTTFKIYLPQVAAEAVATPVTSTAEVPKGRGETILLVEDEKSLRVTCGIFLEALGYNVLVAETPGEALKMADGHPSDIHLLLTDVIMPGMDGRQLAKRLCSTKPGLKVLFMSGYTADVIAQRGVLDEGVQFLAKPFSRDDLARKVREVLG